MHNNNTGAKDSDLKKFILTNSIPPARIDNTAPGGFYLRHLIYDIARECVFPPYNGHSSIMIDLNG